MTLYGQVASANETQSCCIPPDGDIATSASWMVQVNNDIVTMYNWNTNVFVQRSLATFFQDGTRFLFGVIGSITSARFGDGRFRGLPAAGDGPQFGHLHL